MENLLTFFENIQTLKEKKRRGWLLHDIRDSESTAGHIFRTAIIGWVFARERGLNVEKVIKLGLLHDICEVFAFDETPYDPLLPKVRSREDKQKVIEILKNWPKFSLEEREKKVQRKHQRETRAFKKLVASLPSPLKKEMTDLWFEFEEKTSKEARFLKQVDNIENFLQGMEYWEKYGRIQSHLWLRWIKEIIDDPSLVELEEAIEKRFFAPGAKKETRQDRFLEFLIRVGRLKERKRIKWVFRKVPNPETIADHSFGVAMACWVFSSFRPDLNQKKLLKMALVHGWGKVHLLRNFSLYYTLFPNLRAEIKKILNDPLSFSPQEREEILNQTRKKYRKFSKKNKEKTFESEKKSEKSSLQKLISLLPESFSREVLNLWEKFKNGLDKEGVFLRQIDVLENFLQAVKYYKEDQNFPIEPWWLEIGEKISEPSLLKFIETVKNKYF